MRAEPLICVLCEKPIEDHELWSVSDNGPEHETCAFKAQNRHSLSIEDVLTEKDDTETTH